MQTRALTKTKIIPSEGFLRWTENLREDAKEQTIQLQLFSTIGRDESNLIISMDPFISMRHARIEKRDTGYFIRDLRSRNGTFLNGVKILEALLQEGDRITLGQSDFFFSFEREKIAPSNDLVSKNTQWQTTLDRVPSAAQSDLPVLLQGPSGSGKEVLASNLHRYSNRNEYPFVSVNCSALSEALVESELFGHIKGSFTGALHDRPGAFRTAHRGTLFLDEIGDLPLNLQPKLLRALENSEIRPVGSDQNIHVDVRIIAATHQDLAQLVQAGKFREDLYFRLHVLRLKVPALNERMEDFDDLFYFFAKHYRVRFSFNAIAKLKLHHWKGNIRELRNLVARAKAYFGARTVEEFDVADLIGEIPKVEFAPTLGKLNHLKEAEVNLIIQSLILNKGNQRKSAEDLGMAKSTLHDRIRQYGIDVKSLKI